MDYALETARFRAKVSILPDVPLGWCREVGSIVEGMAQFTEVLAPGYTVQRGGEPMSTVGAEAQVLSEWHRYISGLCSDRYHALRFEMDSEGLSKEDLNRDPQLLQLNGMRIGVGRAMRRTYSIAQELSRKSR